MADQTVRFIIKRQPTPDAKAYWEEFDLRLRPGMNVDHRVDGHRCKSGGSLWKSHYSRGI
jgi:hypothetical protein